LITTQHLIVGVVCVHKLVVIGSAEKSTMSRRETAAEIKARWGKPGVSKGNSIAENYARNVAGSAGPLFDQPKTVLNDFAGCIAKLTPLLAMPNMTGVPRTNLKGVIEFLQGYQAPQSVASDETLRVKELEKELAALKLAASEEASKKVGVSAPAGSLPPPSTYAEAVRREFNRAKHAEARADKLNRAKMVAVSSAAAAIRQQEKEKFLREKFKEGYVPLDVRKNKQRIASEAKTKKKPTSVVQKAALVAHTFVRFTRAQMREHQLQVLKATGCDRWFSVAERAAYKALSPARKAEIKAQRTLNTELAQAKKAAEREKFRQERQQRVAALAKARVEALARSNPKQVYKGKGKATKMPPHCSHRFEINSAGTRTVCRDCGAFGTDA